MENEENLQLDIDFLNAEIKTELKDFTPNDEDEPKVEAVDNNAGRKPFRITDFDTLPDRELAVFTRAKKLSEYLFVITEKSPKKLRWSIVERLLNGSTEIIENLYRANYERERERRVEFQKRAMVNLNILDFYAETAKTKRAITTRQMLIIAKQIAEVKKLLTGWIKSTKR